MPGWDVLAPFQPNNVIFATMSKKILIIYDYFTPAFKAGGPIQSITNLVRWLAYRYDFYVLTRNVDLDGTTLDVKSDQWLDFEGKARVFYASGQNTGYRPVARIIKEVGPDVVYINGLFSLFATVFPLLFNMRSGDQNRRFVIAPRGMFQQGALALKAMKKKVFLMGMKPLMKRPNIRWHATDDQEKRDILQTMGEDALVKMAGNVPAVLKEDVENHFEGDVLRLVTVALVVRMKNHLAFLKALEKYRGDRRIVYDIYGPVKDPEYWRECEQVIDKLPEMVEVRYQGAVEPPRVPGILAGYHAYVLPTFGENFGHSIFEALAAGLPVLISDKTPWQNLEEEGAGWGFNLEKKGDFERVFDELKSATSEELKKKGEKAKKLADKYLEKAGLEESYEALFSL
mgnify:CR=1 FL=1